MIPCKTLSRHRPHTIYGEGWYSELCPPLVRVLMAYWHWRDCDGSLQNAMVRDGIVFG